MKLPKFTDIAAASIPIALAGGCIWFAASMVYRLERMDNPPADLGLNFPQSRKSTNTRPAVLVDPLTTGSIDAAGPPSQGDPVQPYTRDTPVLGYRLLAVVDGIAFVEVTTIKGAAIMPLSRGSLLPGAGLIDRIEKAGGRWTLAAGTTRLTGEVQ